MALSKADKCPTSSSSLLSFISLTVLFSSTPQSHRMRYAGDLYLPLNVTLFSLLLYIPKVVKSLMVSTFFSYPIFSPRAHLYLNH